MGDSISLIRGVRYKLALGLTTFALLLGTSILAFDVQPVRAHSGDVFSAWATVTPTIDGVISIGEWEDADSLTVNVIGANGDPHSLTLYVKNDATYLYLAVVVDDEYSDPAEMGYDFLNFRFDNDHDGVTEIGDDGLAIRYDCAVIEDTYNPTGVEGWSYSDISDGGTNDLTGAITHSNPVPNGMGIYTAEYRHPLDSTDDAHDFSLFIGDTVGFKFTLADGDPWPGPNGYFDWPSPTAADIIIAPPPPVIPEVPFGTAMTLVSMFIALIGFVGFKRFRPKF